jgi:hypothetical protein
MNDLDAEAATSALDTIEMVSKSEDDIFYRTEAFRFRGTGLFSECANPGQRAWLHHISIAVGKVSRRRPD